MCVHFGEGKKPLSGENVIKDLVKAILNNLGDDGKKLMPQVETIHYRVGALQDALKTLICIYVMNMHVKVFANASTFQFVWMSQLT